jgi:ribosomal protein S12 methylthiotransferase
VPGITLRTTVMTGFPGETDADFEELCTFIQEVQFERLGCFAFSPEEGTPAAAMPDQIPDKIKDRRRDIVMEEQSRIADRHNQAQIGRQLTVLVEAFDKYAECWFGRSEGDAPDIDGKVFFTPSRPVQPGELVQVEIIDAMDWDLIGEMTE